MTGAVMTPAARLDAQRRAWLRVQRARWREWRHTTSSGVREAREAAIIRERFFESVRVPPLLDSPARLAISGDCAGDGARRGASWLSPSIHTRFADAHLWCLGLGASVSRHLTGLSPEALAAPGAPVVWSVPPEHARSDTARLVRAGGGHMLGGIAKDTRAMCVDAGGVRWGFVRIEATPRAWTPRGVLAAPLGQPNRPIPWDAVQAALDGLRAQGAQVVVVDVRWGWPSLAAPTDTQRDHARRLVALGADLVLGRGPRALHDAELVSINGWDDRAPVQCAREGGEPRAGLIAYSLGALWTPRQGSGAVWEVEVEAAADGITALGMVHVYPVACRHDLGDAAIWSLNALRPLRGERAVRAHLRDVYLPLGSLVYAYAPR